MARGRKKYPPNEVEFVGDLVYIHLRGKHGEGRVAITDLASYLKFNLDNYVWVGVKGNKTYYAHARDTENKCDIRMHRVISRNTTKYHTDHKDKNGLNNLPGNLRICDATENNFNTGTRRDNTTGYKNVTRNANKFVCQVRIKKHKWYMGRYGTVEMAAEAYNYCMRFISPEFTLFNEIPEGSLTSEQIELVHNKVNQQLEKVFGSKLDPKLNVFDYTDIKEEKITEKKLLKIS
ncbi:hypothetical protein D0469_06930 [Peribacillus saganii]|uniref:AP2/ERF domain-containing protein n=1 Tax=Peribacillus saganii TaxID=2303992 RepID=A0A372LQX4_9BACI|nr:hypothetical protein [Peribacillus saganii]RFU70327.1 hypothetical protein D0469_06930 [Peribacillus saganii]